MYYTYVLEVINTYIFIYTESHMYLKSKSDILCQVVITNIYSYNYNIEFILYTFTIMFVFQFCIF